MRLALQMSVLLAFCLPALSGCPSDDSQTARSFERWKLHEPDQYVVQTCTIGIQPPGCIRAVIEGGETVSIAEQIYAERVGAEDFGWEDFTAAHSGNESPLDAMFTRVAAGDGDGCTVQSVEHDPELGYIQSYSLDCEGSVTGGRWVACFEADTTDAERCDVKP
jgi:hypothetical protein